MRAFRSPVDGQRTALRTTADQGQGLPDDIAFLRTYGSVSLATLRRAQIRAAQEGTTASACLIADRGISELLYYQALAFHLDLPFVQSGVSISPVVVASKAIRNGCVRLASGALAPWLLAPRGTNIHVFLVARRLGLRLPDAVITTPTRLSALVRRAASAAIAADASDALPDHDPALSAKGAVDRRLALASACCLAGLVAAILLAPTVAAVLAGLLFFVAISLRLLFCAGGLGEDQTVPPPIADSALPFYSVLVPLYGEAAMLPKLVARLDRLRYPRSKLAIKLIVEDDDKATQLACFSARLGPRYEIIVAPPGAPRTKPRALNVALPLIEDGLVTVFDAEDAPEPDQLRDAATHFHGADPSLGCLQARLSIDGPNTRLAALFAIEYAALFWIFNRGIAREHLPMALGGTSNHFRVAVLREKLGGWDAWNVAEDADLGLRLARFGYRTAVLPSMTEEQAPPDLGNWFRQRRRWTKGWMQAAIVLGRQPRRLHRELGSAATAVLTMLLATLVVGPLAAPPLAILGVIQLATVGLPRSGTILELAEATLWTWVFLASPAATLWTGYVGSKAGGRCPKIGALILMVPYQMLIGIAAWGGLYDLWRDPYHWHKTRHDPAAGSQARGAAGEKKRTGRSSRHPSVKRLLEPQPLRALRAAYLASRAAFRATSSAMTRDARARAAAASAALASSARRSSASRSAARTASRSAR